MFRGHVCKPIKSVRDLLEIPQNPMPWWPLVEPLQPRSVAYRLNDQFKDLSAVDSKLMVSDRRAQTLVCHDFKGNYLTDKFVTGGSKFDDYRFYNWAACDIFCYFSHYFVTVPTLQWLNAAHKHGVKMLGTFIVESRAGHRRLNDEILVSVETARRVADVLVSICEQCKFEGWLINIECTVDEKNIPILKDFLDYLTKQTKLRVAKGSIIWYDSVVGNGVLSWQNELNENNRMFFELCDAIFLNYSWTESHLIRSKDIISRYYPGRRHDVFVGIDIFGRGQVAKMDSHKTLAKIRHEDLSVAIFAPGWTLESLLMEVNIEEESGSDLCNLRFLEKNEQFWKTLWPYLCTTSVHSLPFATSFCLGSGKFENRLGRMVYYGPWFNLTKQELQISVPGITRFYEDAFNGGSCLKLNFDSRSSSLEHRLFVSDFDCSHDLLVAFAIKRDDKAIDLELVLIVSDKTADDRRVKLVCVGNESAHKRRDKTNMGQQETRVRALDMQVVRELTMHVQYRRECHLPGFELINDWEIRHYYVAFDRTRSREIKLTDIGVRMRRVRRTEGDGDIVSSILMGSLAINKGVPPNTVELSESLYPKVRQLCF